LIEVQEPENPRYFDPNAPELPVIMNDEDEVLYLDETEEEARDKADRRNYMYAPVDPEMGDDPNDPHIPDIDMDNTPGLDNEVRHVDQVIKMQELEDNLLVEEELKYPKATFTTNTKALAVIGQAILDALEPYEEEWEILSRHELILTSPNPRPEIIETQKQFDAYRDHHVAVETYDPFGSNRTLKGQLVDRNAMDLLLNIKGRLVTVPLNFVKCVRLPPQSSTDREYKEDEEDEMEDDVEIVEAAAATKGDATLIP
jgi:ribosome maturation factor RimP